MGVYLRARRSRYPYGTYRYLFTASRRAGYARCGHRKVRIHRFHRTLRHLLHRLPAHHTEIAQRFGFHPKQTHLDLLGIGHYPTLHACRTSRHSRQRGSHATTGATFGRRHAPSLTCKDCFDGLGYFIAVCGHFCLMMNDEWLKVNDESSCQRARCKLAY